MSCATAAFVAALWPVSRFQRSYAFAATHRYQRRNQWDTSNFMNLVWFLDLTFPDGVAAKKIGNVESIHCLPEFRHLPRLGLSHNKTKGEVS